MKALATAFFLLTILSASGQDAPDTVAKDFFKMFGWKEIRSGEFEITIPGYDSIRMGNNDFQNFFYTTTDKPDGRLVVRNGKGDKVRECVYRNHLMFDEHWWFSSGEKEFDGVWSETANQYGDQMLEEYTWYYRNRKVRKHGYRNGNTVTYYEDGKTESEKMYREGKPSGPYKVYFPNGKIQTEGQFFEGNKTGEWIHYNIDGTIREREH